MWADSYALMYIIHGILIATNLVITIIIAKFVRLIFRLELKVDRILKSYEHLIIMNNKKESDHTASIE